MHNLTKIRIFRILLYLAYPISLVFLWPIALIKKKKNIRFFFFFDRYTIGGAQRVHIDILNSIKDYDKVVYFTRYSPNNTLKSEFYAISNTDSQDIHVWCENLLFRIFTVHFYAFYLNRHKNAHIFSSNSTFFYDLLPFLSKSLIKTELLHNFTYGKKGMEFFGLANHIYLNNRIVVDNATYHNIIHQYRANNISKIYDNRILLIEPGVTIPSEIEKDTALPLKVLYAGRGGVQKRIWLLNSIAERCIRDEIQISFHFAGTMTEELSDMVKSKSVLHGEITTQAEMYALYKECHAILMTSAYEGFPMLIKEGMACGCIPVVTALEGNKSHLTDNKNSLLIFHTEDEQAVIENGYNNLRRLVEEPSLRSALATQCYEYAAHHFDKHIFTQLYRDFFTSTSCTRPV